MIYIYFLTVLLFGGNLYFALLDGVWFNWFATGFLLASLITQIPVVFGRKYKDSV